MNAAPEIGKSTAGPAPSRVAERAQSRRMLVALVLLLLAIIVVTYRDRDYIFESEQPVAQSETANQTQPSATPVVNQASSSQPQTPQTSEARSSEVKTPAAEPTEAAPATPAAAPKASSASEPKAKPETKSAPKTETAKATSKPAVSVRKQVATPSAAVVTAQAAQRTHVAEVTVVQEPNPALYPRLDQRTKVEGSVELQALVGTDGSIQDLRVMRGPAVLGSAAREAVMQWKFKPYTQNGVPVETYARITVNFTIRVVDGNTKTVASIEPEHVIILADNYQR